MLMQRHSTTKLSARFPREMPAYAKRARFFASRQIDKRLRRPAEILVQVSPRMFAGRSMLCPYEGKGKDKHKSKAPA